MDCPYCNEPAKLMSSTEFYGRDYGTNLYVCKPCDARVGTHKDSNKPLGTMANEELRKLRMEAHSLFDPLWKSKKLTRTKAYAVLQDLMSLPIKDAHIALFNEEQCKEAIAKLKAYDVPANPEFAFRNRGHFCNYCRKILEKKEPRFNRNLINASIWYVWKNPEHIPEFLAVIKSLQPVSSGNKKAAFDQMLSGVTLLYSDKEGYGTK